jgi:hypothetical protein
LTHCFHLSFLLTSAHDRDCIGATYALLSFAPTPHRGLRDLAQFSAEYVLNLFAVLCADRGAAAADGSQERAEDTGALPLFFVVFLSHRCDVPCVERCLVRVFVHCEAGRVFLPSLNILSSVQYARKAGLNEKRASEFDNAVSGLCRLSACSLRAASSVGGLASLIVLLT